METKQLAIDLEANYQNVGNGYLTHNFHPYPAKFIPKLPRSVILNLTKEGDTVLDPFCGCGTTLVEAKLLNRNAIGIDLNPIAVLISKSKTTKIDSVVTKNVNYILEKIKEDISKFYKGNYAVDSRCVPRFKNLDHWFCKNAIAELAIIKFNILQIRNPALSNYLYTAFSSIIVIVSNQESDTRFAAINKDIKPFRTFDEFQRKLIDMNKRIVDFSSKSSDSNIEVYKADSTNLGMLKNNSIDLIVTSPPYANTYDYYLYHKFRIMWLDHDLSEFQNAEIGSRNRHSSKKEDISTFRASLLLCLKEMNRVLKPEKMAVIVIGDSVIRGELIRANRLIKDIATESNFKVEKEISYKLSKVSKMFNPKFTNKDKLEYIMFLKNTK